MARIRLSGKWLEKAGFRTGKKIIVAPEDNKLTIYILDA
ncbi:SymE family type I addiction module toxin [Parasegetibacter sp. NRK P23]